MSTLKARNYKIIALFSFLLSAQYSFAQTGDSSPNYLLYSLIGIGVIVVLGAILSIADNMMQIEAKQKGLDTEKHNFSLYPRLSEMFSTKSPSFVKGAIHSLRRGFDIKLAGQPESLEVESISATRYALKPKNFIGLSPIPKVALEVGDDVKAGDVLFFDKKRPEIKYAAPVSGELVEIQRGDKRAITGVIILADKEMRYAEHAAPSLDSDRQVIVDYMLERGAWALLNQRPFDIVPDINAEPRDVFISTFDTAPLAPDMNLVVKGNEAAFQKGIDVLNTLTTGKVHLGLSANSSTPPSDAFVNADNADKHWFKGAHPAGNVGVQIHHIKPIGSSDRVWTLGVQEVITIGHLFLTGQFKADRLVAITGAEISNPKYIRTYQGANIGELLKDQQLQDGHRIVAGNVLTGKTSTADDFLNFKDNQITVIKEGDEYELFGWLLPIKPRPSVSKTFPGFLMPNHRYEANANTHGERRAFVVTGQYEKVLPMDIMPQHLMKAIMAGNFERMEGLGIYELSEEDVALCEFVCTSKMPLQQILRDGLDMMREQS